MRSSLNGRRNSEAAQQQHWRPGSRKAAERSGANTHGLKREARTNLVGHGEDALREEEEERLHE